MEELETNGNSIRQIYNIDNIEISPVAVSQDFNSADTTDDISGDNISTYSISNLFSVVKNINKNFSPKTVPPLLLNESGTPKKFYHGTNV